jgi:hypothetical protein
MSKSKEDPSTVYDSEVEGMVNRQPARPGPASGDKLIRQIDRAASTSRGGKPIA